MPYPQDLIDTLSTSDYSLKGQQIMDAVRASIEQGNITIDDIAVWTAAILPYSAP